MENITTFPAKRRNIILPLAALGLISGLLTCFVVKNYFDIMISPGIIFGVAIATFFIVSGRERAVGRILGFIVLSAIAYFAAFQITFWFFVFAGFANPSSPTTTLSTLLGFFVGGACGAFILFFAAKASLLPLGNRKWYLFAVAGGLLAPLGWLIGWIIGGTTQNFAFALYSLYVLWQMGMTLVLGTYIRTYEQKTSQETAMPTTSRVGVLVGSVLGIILICYAIPQSLSMKFPSIPYAWQEYQLDQTIEKTYGPQPSLENLPLIAVASSGDMMIDHKIGNYFPETLEPAQSTTATNQDSTGLTQSVVYKELYSPQNIKPADIMSQVAVPVTVTQYPTPAWARYELKDTPEYDYEFTSGELGTSRNNITENKINKFNNVVYFAMDNSQYPEIPGGVYFWTSGDKVVAISFYQPEDDELIKEYLAKYPSDL